jgi:hypothetical protein
MLFICHQRPTQSLGQFFNECVAPEEIITIFTLERLEAFIGVARLERGFRLRSGKGSDCSLV